MVSVRPAGLQSWSGMGFGFLPDIVPFTVSLSVPHKASARLVQVLAALGALETRSVPFQVRRDPKDVLVVDLVPAAHAQRDKPLL